MEIIIARYGGIIFGSIPRSERPKAAQKWQSITVFLYPIFAVILGVTYKLTEKKQSTTKENAPSNNKQSNYTVTEVKIPFSVVGGTSENYIKVEQLFLNAGFSNVKTVPLNDLTFGIKNKVGEVDDIIIDGKEISAYIKRKFNSNVPVVITYHSLRK